MWQFHEAEIYSVEAVDFLYRFFHGAHSCQNELEGLQMNQRNQNNTDGLS